MRTSVAAVVNTQLLHGIYDSTWCRLAQAAQMHRLSIDSLIKHQRAGVNFPDGALTGCDNLLFDNEITDKIIEKSTVKTCLSCLAIGYHSHVHQIIGLDSCPIHRTPLASICPHCGFDRLTFGRLRAGYRCPMCRRPLLADSPTSSCKSGSFVAIEYAAIAPLHDQLLHLLDWDFSSVPVRGMAEEHVSRPANGAETVAILRLCGLLDAYNANRRLRNSAPSLVIGRVITSSAESDCSAESDWFHLYKSIRRQLQLRLRDHLRARKRKNCDCCLPDGECALRKALHSWQELLHPIKWRSKHREWIGHRWEPVDGWSRDHGLLAHVALAEFYNHVVVHKDESLNRYCLSNRWPQLDSLLLVNRKNPSLTRLAVAYNSAT